MRASRDRKALDIICQGSALSDYYEGYCLDLRTESALQAVTMLPCRFMDANGNGSREQAIKCMDWCLKREAHVLSNSWGEVPNSLSLQVWGVINPERPPAAAPPLLTNSPVPFFFPFSFGLQG